MNADVRSGALPGGSLILALLDRRLMEMADRGGSSGIIGHRWGEICAAQVNELIGSAVPIPGSSDAHLVSAVIRIDDQPRLVHRASRLSLQNPDFLLLGKRNGELTVQAVDAKFSAETARSKQVSPDVVNALAALGCDYTSLLGPWRGATQSVPGFFLSPDTALTAYVLAGKRGIIRSTVRPDEVRLLNVTPVQLTHLLPGATLMPILAGVDELEHELENNALAALYYFRLARSATASFTDSSRPLLAVDDRFEVDDRMLCDDVRSRGGRANSAFSLVSDWDVETGKVRNQRSDLDRAVGLPVLNREMRDWTAEVARALGVDPPSNNQVRKRLGSWYKREMAIRSGQIDPPLTDLASILTRLNGIAAEIAPQLRSEHRRVVRELIEKAPTILSVQTLTESEPESADSK